GLDEEGDANMRQDSSGRPPAPTGGAPCHQRTVRLSLVNPGPDSLSAVLLSQAVLIPNLIGTFVFAISGGVAGVKGRVDIFGLAVLAFAAGNAGGITRDLLLGRFPAGSISD